MQTADDTGPSFASKLRIDDTLAPVSRERTNIREYDTRTLFDGGREIIIHHAGAAYRMKITKQGKLILNK